MNRLDRIEARMEREAVPVSRDDLRLLIDAARAASNEDWHPMDDLCRTGRCGLCRALTPLLAEEPS